MTVKLQLEEISRHSIRDAFIAAENRIAALEQRVQELSSVRAKLVETKLPIPDWDDDGTCGPMQSSANPPDPAQPHGTARSEVHQAPITDHAGEGGEPFELRRWEPELLDAWSGAFPEMARRGPAPVDSHHWGEYKAMALQFRRQAHAHYSQQLASLRSALAEATEKHRSVVEELTTAEETIARFEREVTEAMGDIGVDDGAADDKVAALAGAYRGIENELAAATKRAEHLKDVCEARGRRIAEAQQKLKGLRQGKGEREREINRLKARVSELEAEASTANGHITGLEGQVKSLETVCTDIEAAAPRIEPSDEQIVARVEDEFGHKLLEGQKMLVLTVARAVLALTRPPEGAVSWSVKTTMGMAVGIFGCSKEALELPPNQEVHGLFVAVPTGTKEQG